MGVQRKPAQVNWLASFGLIILAGTFYRLRKINQVLFKTQMKEIMQKVGLKLNSRSRRTILSDQTQYKKGEWQQIKLRSNQYRFCQKVHNIVSSTEWFFKGKK